MHTTVFRSFPLLFFMNDTKSFTQAGFDAIWPVDDHDKDDNIELQTTHTWTLQEVGCIHTNCLLFGVDTFYSSGSLSSELTENCVCCLDMKKSVTLSVLIKTFLSTITSSQSILPSSNASVEKLSRWRLLTKSLKEILFMDAHSVDVPIKAFVHQMDELGRAHPDHVQLPHAIQTRTIVFLKLSHTHVNPTQTVMTSHAPRVMCVLTCPAMLSCV